MPFILRYPPVHCERGQYGQARGTIDQPSTVMDIASGVLDLAGRSHPATDKLRSPVSTTADFLRRNAVPMKGTS